MNTSPINVEKRNAPVSSDVKVAQALYGRPLDLNGPLELILLAILLAVAVTHVLQAGISLWWDEAFTVVNFVDAGPLQAWTKDYHSNNHILFTMLSAISGELFGGTEVAYRLPSFGFAIAAYAILTIQIRRRVGRAEALSVGTMLLGSPLLLYWIPQARGYGLTFFASVLVLSGSLALTSSGTDRNGIAYAQVFVGGLIGIATLPHFIIPFTLTCGSLAVLNRSRWGSVAAGWASVGLASVLFYLPSGLLQVASSATGAGSNPRLSAIDALWGPFRFQVVGTLSGTGDLQTLVTADWVPAVVAVLVLTVVLASIRAYRDREWAPLVLSVVPIYGTYVVAIARGLQVTDRTFLFLFPQLTLLFALGIGYWVRSAPQPRTLLWLRRAPLLTILPVVAFLVLRMALGWSALPIESYREASTIAVKSDAAMIITDSARALGFTHYAPNVMALGQDELTEALCDGPDSYAYIAHSFKRGFTPPMECLQDRGAVQIDLTQRRRGTMDVWLVPKASE